MRRFSIFAALLTLAAAPAFAGDLRAEVSGVTGAKSQVECSMHASAWTVITRQTPLQVWVPANSAIMTCRFERVAPRAYAVAVSHASNSNRKTDTNLVGIPTEAWGVSNNARLSSRAPRLDKARFTIPAEGATNTVRIAR